jgi:UDP-glucose 4-epimerase
MSPRKNSKAGTKRTFRLALTGGRTFLGERLVTAMEADPRCEHIVCFDIRAPRSAGPKTRFVHLDLTRPSAEEAAAVLMDDGVDTLCHLAFLAFPSHARSWAHELEAIGSYYLMNAAAAAGTAKMVLASTTMVYGAYPHNPNYIAEHASLKGTPRSRWVGDKVSAERELARLQQERPEMVTTALRFGITLGPTIRSFHTRLLAKQSLPVFMGYDPLMQFLDEDDAVDALIHAVLHDHRGAFNVVGDGVLPYSQVRGLGGKIPIFVPHILALPATGLLWNLDLVDMPPSFMNFYRFPFVADDRKMRSEFGFSPSRTSKEALKRFYASLGRTGVQEVS